MSEMISDRCRDCSVYAQVGAGDALETPNKQVLHSVEEAQFVLPNELEWHETLSWTDSSETVLCGFALFPADVEV